MLRKKYIKREKNKRKRRGKMKGAYPAFIKQVGEDFLAYVPDWEIYTEGNSFVDVIEMIRDAIGLKGIDKEDDRIDFPKASTYKNALEKARMDADEDIDFTTGIQTLVDVDFFEYRRKYENKSVKKNCTIPYWMSIEAEKADINYSKLLQDAIMSKLGLSR